jgi:hypothetical protein
VLSWLGTTNPSSPFYGGQILSASLYDNDNQNNLYYSIPEYLREDPANDPYQLFIEMIGQHYDNIWIYYRDVTQKYNADNRLENGISKDIVADAIRDFGIKLYQNNFSNEDLYTAFLGLTPEGNLFPFPNITGSLPTPSGYEYINTKISASNDYLPLDDVNKSLYKRIYHNLPYLLQTKGTLPGLRALITSYGIPDTILRIKEYGGKDKINTNDWDYWQNEFNYAYKQNGDNFISSSFVLNSEFDSISNNPETVMFRFKTNGLPTSVIPYSQSLFTLQNSSNTPSAYITLRYTGSAYTSGSYNGSIIDPYYQYAYLDFYPNYINQPTLSASIYLPFFNEDWWSVMVKRTLTGGGTNFELYSGNKMYEGGENGTSIGFITSSSIIVSPTVWNNSITALFGSGSITISSNVNAGIYNKFSGSFQEIRYYTKPISESVFKDFVMNPSSIEGNSINSGADQLAFRLPLGGELYTGSKSIHPKVTGSWITTSSFFSDSTASFNSTPTFVPNTEYFYYDQPIAGIKNSIADKIRIKNNVIPEGDVLSPFMSLSQQANISQSYTANTNLLEVAFSPQDEVNDDINSSLGYFNIGEYIGDPRLRSSSAEFYPDLNALRDSYFQKYTKNYNLVDFVRLIKFFDNSLFKMIKDFVPARTSLASGIVIKQHILERNKVPQPQVDTNSPIAYYTSGSVNNQPLTFQDISVSGTLLPQWNDYNAGTVENFDGGTAGTFEMFNGTVFAPSGSNIFNLTQSWSESYNSPLGLIDIIHNSQDEFYNGEFEGSVLTVTTQSLNLPFPISNEIFDYTPVRYSPQNYGLNTTSSFAESQFLNVLTVPDQGEILLLRAYSKLQKDGSTGLSSPYVKIHKKDNNGFDNSVTLGQATRLRIKYTTESGYLTIGNILTKTEYPTYWLYKVQSLGSNTADDYVIDYMTLASFSSSIFEFPFTTNPTTGKLFPYYATSSNNQFFNQTDGIYTIPSSPSRPPNIAITLSASLLISSSFGGQYAFMLLKPGLDESEATFMVDSFTGNGINVSWGADEEDPLPLFRTVSVSGRFFPTPGDRIFLSGTTSGEGYCRVLSGSFLVTQSIAPSAKEYDLTIIEPYITEPNFYNSDDNALLNSVSDQRESTFALDADYSDGTTPINFALLVSGTATPATVPDSNYTSKKSILSKYEGSKSTSQFLNQWTLGDTGTYGKLPTVESLRNAFMIAGWIGGWPPEIEGASAANIGYIVKEDGTLIKPWSTPNALSDLRQYFTDGERVTISTLENVQSSNKNYYKILKSGYQVKNILYTQIGQSPSQTFTASLSLVDKGNSATSIVEDYQIKVASDWSSPTPWLNNSMTSTFEEINFPILLTSGSFANIQTVTNPRRSPGTGNTTNTRYYVSQSLVDDKVDLTFNFKLFWSYFPNKAAYEILLANKEFRPPAPTSVKVYYQLIRLRNGSETIINDNPNGIELNNPSTLSGGTLNISYKETSDSFTVLSTNLKKDDVFYLKAKAVLNANSPEDQYMYIEAGSELNIIQNPISNQTISIENFWISSSYLPLTAFSSSFSNAFFQTSSVSLSLDPVSLNQINSGGFAGTNILYTTSSVFKNNFDNKFAWGKDIPSSGFNTIETYWNIIPGDEFKFEGKENQRYRVLKAGIVSCSGYVSSSVLAVEFDRPLPTSGSLNYDKFSIQRYIDFEGNLIFEGFRPSVNGPFIITPEFITPNLNKNIGKILEDLTQKGLLT